MNFWKIELNTFDIWVYLGILIIIFLLSNTLSRKITIIRNSLLPTAIIAGIITLILKYIGLFDTLVNVGKMDSLLEAITYNASGSGVVALRLTSNQKTSNKEANN